MNNYAVLKHIAQTVLTPLENKWLEDKLQVLEQHQDLQKLQLSFSLVARKIAKQTLKLEESSIQAFKNIYPGFLNENWNKQDLVRAILMLTVPTEKNNKMLTDLFESAAMQEQISFFKALFLLSNAKDFTTVVEEGIRTNMVNVFDSFALHNPFVANYLQDWAWNQLILKLFFLDRPLYKVYDVDTRKNKALADMLQDYVKERWAAHRTISPEIWRLIKGNLREDVKALIHQKTFTGTKKEAIYFLVEDKPQNETETTSFWNNIGTKHLKTT